MSGVLTPAQFANLDPPIWEPSDSTLLEAISDTGMMTATTLLVAGTLYLMRMVTKRTATLTNLEWFTSTAGAGASTGSFSGLYSAAGVLLAGSADIGAQLVAGNRLSVPLTTPQLLIPGQVTYRALLCNLATTQATMAVVANNNTIRFNTPIGGPSAGLRASVNGTGLVALPANITPANNVQAGAFPLWTAST